MQLDIWTIFLSAIICHDNVPAMETKDSAGKKTWANIIAQNKDKLRIVTPEELSKHASVEDGWLAIGDDVFNITSLIGNNAELSILEPFLGREADADHFKELGKDFMDSLREHYIGALLPTKSGSLGGGKLLKIQFGTPNNRHKNTVTEGELRRHNTPDSAWVAIERKVYNITSMLKSDPDQMSAYIKYLGKDATQLFESEDRKKSAEELWSNYIVGDLMTLGMINMKYIAQPERDAIYHSITPNQLAEHNKIENAWIAIEGRVYDITKYIHETQNEELIALIGKDATEELKNKNPNFGARFLFNSLYLGPLSDPIKGGMDKGISNNREKLMAKWEIIRKSHTPSTPRDISEAELAEHNKRNDGWIAHNGDVYDLTEFIEFLPNSPARALLISHLGNDGSYAFKLACEETMMGSPDKFLNNFRLGKLVENNTHLG